MVLEEYVEQVEAVLTTLRNHPPSLREVPLQGGELVSCSCREQVLESSKQLTPLPGGVAPQSGDGVVSDGIHIIAHSFGARVAVLLANRNPGLVDKMVLTGAAGLKPRFNLRVWLRVRWFKLTGIGKGSSDYRKLSPAGKRTFKNIIRRDLSGEIAGLQVPAMLIWGGRDKSTPLYMAKRWTTLQKGATLKIYKHAGHFCFIDDPGRFVKDVWEFFSE